MKFAFALLSIVAALRFVGAGPVAESLTAKHIPLPVTKLFCDGAPEPHKCTAFLDYADGKWVAQWSTSIYHLDQFGYLTEKPITSMMAPVRVIRLSCDLETYKCTGNLDFDDGNWFAQWNAVVVEEQALFSQEEVIDTMAASIVTEINCNAYSYRCIADMVGNLVAYWDISVFHQSPF